MKIKVIFFNFLPIFFLLLSCGSTKLVQQYKNPNTENFEANKVLVVGITGDKELRRTYEKKLTEALDKKGIIAVKSIDFFETSFTENKKSLSQLDSIEKRLLEAGFDAILFTKVIGREARVSLVEAYRNFAKSYQRLDDYFYDNIQVYYIEPQEPSQAYTTETSLFCICPSKERELLWRGEIEWGNARKVDRNINTYIKILFQTLHGNKLLCL